MKSTNKKSKKSKKPEATMQATEPQSKMPMANSSKSKSKVAVSFLVVLLVIALAGGGYMYYRYSELQKETKLSAEEKMTNEAADVSTAIKKVLYISETEEPSIAKANDIQKLKAANPDFYKDIAEGDYVVVFSKRAIIYRLSTNMIINYAPIVETPTQDQNQTQSQITTDATNDNTSPANTSLVAP